MKKLFLLVLICLPASSYLSGQTPQQASGSMSITITSHKVTLSWTASTSAVVAYNVYRGTTSGGPYTKLTSTATTIYVDTSVLPGQTLFYVTTAVDASGNESALSNQATAVIPTP